ncbi:MAG: hypothetical protein WAU86_17440, partial [Oricola sp.]
MRVKFFFIYLTSLMFFAVLAVAALLFPVLFLISAFSIVGLPVAFLLLAAPFLFLFILGTGFFILVFGVNWRSLLVATAITLALLA